MNLAEELRQHPFTAGLADAHLDVMLACAREQDFARGSFALRQNQEIRDFLLLIDGRIALETCDTRNTCIPLQTLEAGAVLGWSWLIPPYHSFFDARVLSDATCIALDCATPRAAMDADHDFGYAFLKRALKPMMSRLQACRLQLVDVYGDRDPAG